VYGWRTELGLEIPCVANVSFKAILPRLYPRRVTSFGPNTCVAKQNLNVFHWNPGKQELHGKRVAEHVRMCLCRFSINHSPLPTTEGHSLLWKVRNARHGEQFPETALPIRHGTLRFPIAGPKEVLLRCASWNVAKRTNHECWYRKKTGPPVFCWRRRKMRPMASTFDSSSITASWILSPVYLSTRRSVRNRKAFGWPVLPLSGYSSQARSRFGISSRVKGRVATRGILSRFSLAAGFVSIQCAARQNAKKPFSRSNFFDALSA
jgi:hypothetical protein